MKYTHTWSGDIFSASITLDRDSLLYQQEIQDSDGACYPGRFEDYLYRQPAEEFRKQGPEMLLPRGFELFHIPKDVVEKLVETIGCQDAPWWKAIAKQKHALSLSFEQRAYKRGEEIKGRLIIKGPNIKIQGISLSFKTPPNNVGLSLGKLLQIPAGSLDASGRDFTFQGVIPEQQIENHCINLVGILDLFGGDDPMVIQPVFIKNEQGEEADDNDHWKFLPQSPLPKLKNVVMQGIAAILRRKERTSLPWLTIEFEKPDPFYFTNEEPRGALIIKPEESMTCSSMSLTLGWEIKTNHKRPKKSESQLSTISLDGSDSTNGWSVAREHHREFHLNAFRAPYSYRGKSFQIDCFLLFRADIPWGFDPEIRIPLRVDTSQMLEEEERKGAFGSMYQEPTPPVWSTSLNGRTPTIKLDARLLRAGQEVSLTLIYEFDTQAVAIVSFVTQEQSNLTSPPIIEEVQRETQTININAGDTRLRAAVPIPKGTPRTFVERACSITSFIEISISLAGQTPSVERFSITVMPFLQDADPYRG